MKTIDMLSGNYLQNNIKEIYFIPSVISFGNILSRWHFHFGV